MSEFWDCGNTEPCALAGAAAFFAGIPGGEILANGPLWCYFYALRYLEHAAYGIAERFHGSQPDNNAVVYGTEKFLLAALDKIKKKQVKPAVLLIENSCSIGLIGDDIAGIAKEAKLDFPVVTMDCGGLMGNFAKGYAGAAVKLFETISIRSFAKKEPRLINVLGLTDFYFNGKADREEILRILAKAGYKINVVLGAGSPLDKIRDIDKAALNVVINEELGMPVAQYLQQKYQIPFVIAGMPYGIEGTKSWLQRITRQIAANMTAVYAECDEMSEHLLAWNNDICCSWGNLWFDNVVIYAAGTAALGLAGALRGEWLDTAYLQVVCQQKIITVDLYSSMPDKVYNMEDDADIVKEKLKISNNTLVLGSSNENRVVLRQRKNNNVFCNIAYPSKEEVQLINYPFAGIKGSAYMLQRLWNVFIHQKINRSFGVDMYADK
ncbi:nitrogenase component 1 [Pectinatus sottacetonis]|uniref:nitrogenase component 1 n=1 Tax=Pectinatus sottacetonis TaxID=1002795 RepID=UPI0018C7618F|nr:nitrogenase component 1 [Pectinatus sottacetonis]